MYKHQYKWPYYVKLYLLFRYYALTATSGLLTYLQDYMYIYYATNSIKVECEASQGYAFIGNNPVLTYQFLVLILLSYRHSNSR